MLQLLKQILYETYLILKMSYKVMTIMKMIYIK